MHSKMQNKYSYIQEKKNNTASSHAQTDQELCS
jgi:hypothetical protein